MPISPPPPPPPDPPESGYVEQLDSSEWRKWQQYRIRGHRQQVKSELESGTVAKNKPVAAGKAKPETYFETDMIGSSLVFRHFCSVCRRQRGVRIVTNGSGWKPATGAGSCQC